MPPSRRLNWQMISIEKLLRPALSALLVLSGFIFWPQSSLAQTDLASYMRPYEIFAVLWRGETEVEAGFRDYLNQRGILYNMTVRSLELDRSNAPPIIEEIRRKKPDLVYTWGTGTTLSIIGPIDAEEPARFVQGIPGLFVLVAYPISANIVESFESTGRPLTGVSFLAAIESQIKAILDYGDFKKIGVIYDSTSSNSRINVASLEEKVSQFGLDLVVLPIPLGDEGKPDPETLPGLIRTAKSEGVDVLYMGPDSFLTRHADVYTAEAIANGLPTFASTQAPLKGSRAMFGLVSDYHTLGKLAAVQAEKILIGKQQPEQLPVASLSRFKLWINIDVVREVMLYPPMNVIAIADFKMTAAN